MARIKHFATKIVVDGEPLPEHEPDEDEKESINQPNTVVKYIEVSDAEFSFEFAIDSKYKLDCDYLCWDIYVDGKFAVGEVTSKDRLPERRIHSVTMRRTGITSQKDGRWFKENYKFSDMSFGEQTHRSDQVSADHISKVGTLKVDLWRRKLRKRTTEEKHGRRFQPLERVSEKSIKGQALSHTVDLGPKRSSGPINYYNGDRIGDRPLATFIFKYRSKKALRDLMIIPRSPSSSLPPEERPVENLTVEEMRELIERQRAEAAIKGEAQPGVKREARGFRSPRRLSSSITAGGSGIDPGSDIECTGSRPLKKTKIEKISLLDD